MTVSTKVLIDSWRRKKCQHFVQKVIVELVLYICDMGTLKLIQFNHDVWFYGNSGKMQFSLLLCQGKHNISDVQSSSFDFQRQVYLTTFTALPKYYLEYLEGYDFIVQLFKSTYLFVE